MVTQSQRGIVKPIERLSLHTSPVSPIPKSPFLALKDPNWCNAMYDEYNTLVKNGTWILVPRPTDANLVRSMWLFKHKFHADGTLSRYKARLVANGSSQQLGVDFDETFSLFVKPATIRTVLSLVVSRQWPIHQLDVKNTFFNGDLSETVYMHQPLGFVDFRYPNHIVDSLHKEFDMTDLEALNYFLGISAVRLPIVDTDSKFGPDGVPVQDPTLYRSLAGGFRHLELGLHLYASATTSLVGYIDADWACCPSTHMSTSGYCVFLGDNLLSCLSTLHFLKIPKNSFEVLKLSENSVEGLKILKNKLESMKILENKLESLKLQENQPVDGLVLLSIKNSHPKVFCRGCLYDSRITTASDLQGHAKASYENHREEEDQEGNNSPEIETLPLLHIHGGSHHDFFSVKASDLSSDHSVGGDDDGFRVVVPAVSWRKGEVTTLCWWRLWWWGRRVVKSDVVDLVDRGRRSIFGVHRKSSPKKFSGGGWWPAAAGGRNSTPYPNDILDEVVLITMIIVVNVLPPDHLDDVPVVEPNQHDDVLVVPEPVLEDEDEDLEEEVFEEEEDDPQEEEDDMEVDIKEDENEPELTYPYKEMDSLNLSSSASESEPEDVIEVENPIEHKDETVPASVHEAECKKFKKEIEEARFGNTFLGMQNERVEIDLYWIRVRAHEIMPPKSTHLIQAAIHRMIKESTDVAIAAERARQANAGNDARGSRPVRGLGAALAVRECTFTGFMKCNPTTFHGTEGDVELRRWFKKAKSVFRISECTEGKKVKFAAVILQGPSLTWWNAKVATIEVQRMEQELWNLKVKEYNIVAYPQRFSELAFICSRVVEPERVEVDAYILGLTDNIKGEVTSSKRTNLNKACHKCGKIRHKARYCKEKNVAIGTNALPILTCYDCAFKDAEPKCSNVVTGTFLLNNRYAFVLFDLGSDRSFVDTRFSSMLNINPVKIRASYEVELADGRIVSTNTILKGCTLNLLNHIFEIDLMPIELCTLDVIIGMDWLVKHDAIIGCGEKVVRIPYVNTMLIVESDKVVSRLKFISCIKARKYVEQCFHLFLEYVMEKKWTEKRLEDVLIICDFPKVLPEELPGLLPPRQVKF
nr:ribonuclease H-like domain-containing protein [Tanacetum cinerariifolium]